MKGWIYIAFIMLAPIVRSQGSVGYLYRELASDSIQNRNLRIHTSLKPAIRLSSDSDKYARINGLVDLNYLHGDQGMYKTGIGAEFTSLINDKWYFRVAGVHGISNADSIFGPKSYLSFDGTSQFRQYTDIRSRISYTPNHIFNFQAGVDHNFIGEGSRSLLLSDYGTPYPFGLIRANFWRFEYSILYQFMRERDNNRWEGKFMSSHHISFNAAPWLNIGIFESVIFQPKDTLLNRGFDVEYLNPFIFYRPQEYSLGSSDNVLLGMELTARVKNYTIYSQLILDEFYLAELRARSGWWANKFGAQLGVKGRWNIGDHAFFFRTEYNFTRPYTFAHISEELNYGNQGTPLAHPYGANFMEVLGELKWSRNKWNAELFMSYYVRGLNHNGAAYGGDIYDSYVDRPFDYGHFIGQGHQVNGFNTMLSASYEITPHGKISAFAENHLRLNTRNIGPKYMFVVGVRSLLWNDYRNY